LRDDFFRDVVFRVLDAAFADLPDVECFFDFLADFFVPALGLQLPFVPGFLPGVGSYPGQHRPACRLFRSF